MSNEKELIAGFNAGYLIEQHDPKLAKKLTEAVSEVEEDFFQGFVEGSNEYSKERSRAKLLDKLRGDLSSPTRSSKAKDMDKNGPDMER